jgi:crotonobetainyl-CoA:carnitine CoA-transferase CaiB-like acyl-CoA transferase
MMQPTKFWADVCRHMDLPELADDPRFGTAESMAANTAEAAEILAKAMVTRTLAEWAERFSTLAGPWAPVQDTLQVAQDIQVRANEYLVRVGELELVTNPVQFEVTAPDAGPAPKFAEQTDEILEALGLDWDRIIDLKTRGAVT